MEEKLVAVRLRMQPEIDSGELVVPDVTAEEVLEMIHAHLEESRVRREHYEKLSAAHRWGREYPPR
jgi:hypothetical protein